MRELKGFLREPQVLALFPVSRSSWWQGIKAGIFPRPIKLSKRTIAWRVEDIEALIERASQGGEG
jgi:prophage regulatory protein